MKVDIDVIKALRNNRATGATLLIVVDGENV
jgi:hypothetical protein